MALSFFRYVSLTILLLGTQVCYPQQVKVDSVRNLISTAATDTARIRLLLLEIHYLEELDMNQTKLAVLKALPAIEASGTPKEIAKAYYYLASAYTSLGNFDSAFQALRVSERIGYEENDKGHIADIIHALGAIYSRKGNEDSSLFYKQKALELYQELGAERDVAIEKIKLGIDYISRSEYEKAMNLLMESVAYFEPLKDHEQLEDCYLNLGNIQYYMGNFDKCLIYYDQAYKTAEKREDKVAMGNFVANSALVNIQLEKFELAKSYSLKALQLFQEAGEATSEVIVLGNLGLNYMYLKQGDSMKYYFEFAIEKFLSMGSTEGLHIVYNDYGYALTELGNYDEALAYYEKGLAIAKEQDDKYVELALIENKSLAYEKMGRPAEALALMNEAYEKREEVFKKDMLKSVSDAEAKYETEKTQTALATSKLQLAKEQNKNLLIGGIAGLILLIVGGIFLFFLARRRAQAREAQLALQLKETEAHNLRELDQLKSRFFANISHEFRTPLTLIMSPIKRFLSGEFKGDPTTYYHTIHRNGERLLELVNQLLDLSRLESGRMVLKQEPGNLSQFIKGVAYSFLSLAETKHIHYQIDIPGPDIFAAFDQDKLLKIISNLVTNAMKFTPEEGKVSLLVSGSRFLVQDAGTRTPNQEPGTRNLLSIQVSDTGIGIPSDQLPHIFDRFYRVESNAQQGTGIGLALTKELVELHVGEIGVESVEGFGTTFHVRLPLEEIQAHQVVEKHELEKASAIASERIAISETTTEDERPLLLIVEDNEEVRNLIVSCMAGKFKIMEAEDGNMGLKKAKEAVPDLIISDVMMPLMDGIEMLDKLKSQVETSHIPVIMLTAKAEHEDRLEGLKSGAEAYMEKPFDPKELQIRSNNLIEQRLKLQARYATEVYLKPKDVAVNSADEKFLQRVIDVIEEYMGDEAFSIEDLGREVGMSRSQLHRKLKAMTGKSSSLFLRSLRLQRAMDLLRQGAGTSAEIAYTVGFSSPAYFTKCFREQFGMTPGEVKGGE
jgi:signal transduction histidine kinase/CheY-like chemotaxis protein